MIGVFDSGVGGLSVLKALREKMPDADFFYFGDTMNAPYGSRPPSEIATLCAGSLRRLYAAGCRQVVVACNSASAALRKHPPDILRVDAFSVLDMLPPVVESVKGRKRIAFFATPATVSSGMYERALGASGTEAFGIAIPDLARMIEEHAPRESLQEIINGATAEGLSREPEAILLACTHYPLVRELFEKSLDHRNVAIPVIDPAHAVADYAATLFPHSGGRGSTTILFSKETAAGRALAERLFGSVPILVKENMGEVFNLHFS